mgnify:CR=1 FL=1|tara:strand:- start:662 stop:2140 length:1479 start_codon:yes stop_codon:yes gene_type:complete
MKKNYILTLLIVLTSTYYTHCQIIVPSGDFETWQNVGTSDEEPTNWNSNKTGSGSASIVPQSCFREASNPHSGNYCLKLENSSFFGTIVVAQTTTGQIQHPTFDPADHYISTVTANTDFNAPFIGRPDSLVGWFRFTQGGLDIGRVSAFLHDNYNYEEPDQGGSASHLIASAVYDVPNGSTAIWTRFSIPFIYVAGSMGNTTPTHILLIATASNTPSASSSTILWVDDLEVIYCTPTTSTLNVTECNSYTSPSGKVWTSSNTYLDTIPNSTNCDSIITINLTVNNSTTNTISVTSCDSYTSPSGNYTWTNSNTYLDTIPNTSNCDSIITVNLTINSVSSLTTTTSGVTISANNSSAIYQWLDCDNNNIIIIGESGQSFVATSNGNYAVELTENGCVDTSACVAITTVGILENSFGNNLLVYPNPTNGNFSVDLGKVYKNCNILINDISGKQVASRTMTESQTLNLSIQEPAGIYIVSIQAGDKKAIIRLIKE